MLVSCRKLCEARHSFTKKAVTWLPGDFSNGSVPYHSLDTESSRSMGLVLPETFLSSLCILAWLSLGMCLFCRSLCLLMMCLYMHGVFVYICTCVNVGIYVLLHTREGQINKLGYWSL